MPVAFKLVSVRDLPPFDYVTMGEHPMEQRYLAVASSLRRSQYTFVVTGSVDPGVYVFELVSTDGQIVSSDQIGVLPEIANQIKIDVALNAPTFGEFKARLTLVRQPATLIPLQGPVEGQDAPAITAPSETETSATSDPAG
jgi:hypothetical protein